VRVQPSSESEVSGTLEDGMEVMVTDGECPEESARRNGCSVSITSGFSGEGEYWVHVAAEDGLSGWTNAAFLRWAQ
jgi:hypothetical protein